MEISSGQPNVMVGGNDAFGGNGLMFLSLMAMMGDIPAKKDIN